MFTGIIKAKGTIQAMTRQGGDVRMTVRSPDLPWNEFELGESIAVNGVCLTAVGFHVDGFDTDVSLETLNVTALGQLQAAWVGTWSAVTSTASALCSPDRQPRARSVLASKFPLNTHATWQRRVPFASMVSVLPSTKYREIDSN